MLELEVLFDILFMIMLNKTWTKEQGWKWWKKEKKLYDGRIAWIVYDVVVTENTGAIYFYRFFLSLFNHANIRTFFCL